MKRLLAVVLAMMFLAAPALCQARQIDILKCDIRIDASQIMHQAKMSYLDKVLGLFLPSQALATSCVATNTAAASLLNKLVTASTGGLNSGLLVLASAADAPLATLTCNSTFGTVSNNVLTFGAISDNTASGGAPTNCTKAFLQNAAGTTFFTVDVAAASASIIMSSVAITTGDTIHVTTAPTITLNLGT